MRKAIAGLLIRAAHRIYRPKVTEFQASGTVTFTDLRTGQIIRSSGSALPGGGGGGGTHRPDA